MTYPKIMRTYGVSRKNILKLVKVLSAFFLFKGYRGCSKTRAKSSMPPLNAPLALTPE